MKYEPNLGHCCPDIPHLGVLLKVLHLLVCLAPTGWKFYNSSIVLRKQLIKADSVLVPAEYDYVWAGPEEIKYMDTHPEATSSAAYERRAQRGDSCLCLKKDGCVIAYHWITRRSACLFCGFGPGYEILFFSLSKNQVFTYDLYVYEAHRRRGVATILRKLLFRALVEEGNTEIFTHVDPDNQNALRLNLGFGYEPICMAYQYRIRSWNKTLFGPVRNMK